MAGGPGASQIIGAHPNGCQYFGLVDDDTNPNRLIRSSPSWQTSWVVAVDDSHGSSKLFRLVQVLCSDGFFAGGTEEH